MKGFQVVTGFVFGIAFIFVVFVTSFEVACYGDYGFYQKEYEKYDVNNPDTIVDMSMEELMRVTKEMMKYLRGEREDLVIYAKIDGVQKEMFQDIEKSHMVDVRELFLCALEQRILCMILLGGSLVLLYFFNDKNLRKTIFCVCKYITRTIWSAFLILGILICLCLIHFDAVFVAMHLILFDNENWLLDPSVSRLINILPEGFFIDMGIRIAISFILINFLILSLAFLSKRGMIDRNTKKLSGGTYEQG